jgi:hypothetical protein
MNAELLLRLELGGSVDGHDLARKSIGSLLSKLPLAPLQDTKLQKVDLAIDAVFSQIPKDSTGTPAIISLLDTESAVLVEILNRSLPLQPHLLREHEVFEDVIFENRGRHGQSLTITLEKSTAGKLNLPATPAEAIVLDPAEVQFRPVELEEFEKVGELFWRVYDYNYVNDLVYYPEKLHALSKSGQLVSMGAWFRGRLIGHLGLVRWKEREPVWEAALGVTDPSFKSGGLFRTLFASIMNRAHNIPMSYTFFDCVCNHDLSQRLIVREGGIDSALLVGCQTADRQASLKKLGLGEDPSQMYRYSLLFMILKQSPAPFGNCVQLPFNIGEKIGFVLDELGLAWKPSPRISPHASHQGRYLTSQYPDQRAIYFDFEEPGFGVVNQMLMEWKDFLRDGAEYASVDLPLESPALAIVHNILCENGFFVAGFIPYRGSTRLGLRLQSLAPTRVDFEHIKVFSPLAKRIRDAVRLDYERNTQV